MVINETSQPVELLVAVDRDSSRTLGAQLEDQLRRAIRDGALRPGAALPSTRDLARQITVSRRVVVDAYAQLAAEGYLSLRQGTRPRVSPAPVPRPEPSAVAPPPAPRARFDFRLACRTSRRSRGQRGSARCGRRSRRSPPPISATVTPAGLRRCGRPGGLPRPGPWRRGRSRAHHHHQRLHARPGAGVPRPRGGRREGMGLEAPSNPQDRLIVARAGLRRSRSGSMTPGFSSTISSAPTPTRSC